LEHRNRCCGTGKAGKWELERQQQAIYVKRQLKGRSSQIKAAMTMMKQEEDWYQADKENREWDWAIKHRFEKS
jgi:hypothetical protein